MSFRIQYHRVEIEVELVKAVLDDGRPYGKFRVTQDYSKDAEKLFIAKGEIIWKELEAYDTALPQDFFDAVLELVGRNPAGHVVWWYGGEAKVWGEAVAVTPDGHNILEAYGVAWAEKVADRCEHQDDLLRRNAQ